MSSHKGIGGRDKGSQISSIVEETWGGYQAEEKV